MFMDFLKYNFVQNLEKLEKQNEIFFFINNIYQRKFYNTNSRHKLRINKTTQY